MQQNLAHDEPCLSCGRYEHRKVSIDGILFSADDEVLLIKRKTENEAIVDQWSLPGGYLEWDESAECLEKKEISISCYGEGEVTFSEEMSD